MKGLAKPCLCSALLLKAQIQEEGLHQVLQEMAG